MDKIKELQNMINNSKNIVFFGGAGVSTESGIKDFRSKDGLYHMKYKYPPERILSHTFFMNKTKEFYDFYKDKLNCIDKKPNIVHNFLTKLENSGKLKAIITQNIDGLHEKAKSKNVLELHGSIYRNYCMKCNKFYKASYVFSSKIIPLCSCGGTIKPDVVLYEEGLNQEIIESSINYIENADLLLICGTSLTVYPASGLVNYFRGKNIVIINNDTTDYDNKASLVINNSLKDVFEKLSI